MTWEDAGEICFTFNQDGEMELYNPYCTIDVQTEEEFETIKAALEHYSKRGRWIRIEDAFLEDTGYKCSVCGEEFVLIEGTPEQNLYNYCPDCGAKMDG